jgi:HEPN domain-containing protein
MSVPPEVVEVAQRWVDKAEHDFEAATRIMAVEGGCPYDTVCFHCQQVVEKYLKALLTLAGIHAPRTHDLGLVRRLLPEQFRLSVEDSELASLNPYAVDTRYADDWRNPSRDEALSALSIASKVREEARALLPPDVLS